MPVGKLVKIGVWEDGVYKGALIFGRGANKSLLEPYGLKQTEGCELVRIALNKHKYTVTRMVKIAIQMLKRQFPDMKLIVSFADTEQGHEGKIYKAGNWIYAGLTNGADEYIYNGKKWHGRAFRKMFGSHLKYDVKIIKGSRKHRYLMPLTKRLKQAMADQQHSGGVAPT